MHDGFMVQLRARQRRYTIARGGPVPSARREWGLTDEGSSAPLLRSALTEFSTQDVGTDAMALKPCRDPGILQDRSPKYGRRAALFSLIRDPTSFPPFLVNLERSVDVHCVVVIDLGESEADYESDV